MCIYIYNVDIIYIYNHTCTYIYIYMHMCVYGRRALDCNGSDLTDP